jgi:hypothetical protein
VAVDNLAPREAEENYLRTNKFFEALSFKSLFNIKLSCYKLLLPPF